MWPVLKPGWVNIDLFAKESDLQLDVRERWPFHDNSASVIYSEHFLEHLTYWEMEKVLSEAWRVLMSGGVFSLAIPNFLLFIQSYERRDAAVYRRLKEFRVPPEVMTPMDQLNYTFRQGGEHKYSYDFETLTKVLKAANFVSIVERSFDPTLDSAQREWETLYAQATKP